MQNKKLELYQSHFHVLNNWWKTHFYSPEITWQQEDNADHAGDKSTADDVTQQVNQNGTCSEEEVKEWSHRMPENQMTL